MEAKDPETCDLRNANTALTEADIDIINKMCVLIISIQFRL